MESTTVSIIDVPCFIGLSLYYCQTDWRLSNVYAFRPNTPIRCMVSYNSRRPQRRLCTPQQFLTLPPSTPHLAEDEGENYHTSLPEHKQTLLNSHWELPQTQKTAHGI